MAHVVSKMMQWYFNASTFDSLRGQLGWPFLWFLLWRRCSKQWEPDRYYPSPLKPSIRLLPIYGSCDLEWSLYRVKGICGYCTTTMVYGFSRQKLIAFRIQGVACAGLVGSSFSDTDNLGCLVQQWNRWMVAMLELWWDHCSWKEGFKILAALLFSSGS